jgi:Ni,Fe-hydrogenase I small subunit
MPNFFIGVLAQINNSTGINACPVDTSFMDEIYFTPFPVINVNACPVDTSFMDEIYFTPFPVINVNACPVDTSFMNEIYDI